MDQISTSLVKILNFLAQSSLKLENTKRQIVGDWRKSRRGSESTESVPSKKATPLETEHGAFTKAILR